MREIRYTMHFRGRMSPAATDSKLMRTTGSATSCTVSTIVGQSGLEADRKSSEGDLAFLESALRITGPDSFLEDGTIAFGDDSEHLLRFSTLGHGHFARSVEPGILAGTASWRVDGGQGQFAAASGYITSTFTLSESGELNDVHCGLIFLPE
jgi:hypothetical protein